MNEIGISREQYEELRRRGWRLNEIALAMPSELEDELSKPAPKEPYAKTTKVYPKPPRG